VDQWWGAGHPYDRLVLTRVEVEFDDRGPNDTSYDFFDGRSLELVTTLSHDITFEAEEMLSVFGVVSPIPTATTTGDLPVQYVLENSITNVRYAILDPRTNTPVQPAQLQPVVLRRRHDPVGTPNSYASSVYEFELEVRPAQLNLLAGSYELLLQCLDSNGTPVPGGEERLELEILPGS
jgi:hypothetical protein